MSWVSTLRGHRGNKVGLAIEELYRAEHELASTLVAVADRQKMDHEVFHVARDIAGWSQQHVARLALIGQDYGLDLDPEADDGSSVLGWVRQKAAEASGRHHDPGLLLLADLRHVHRLAAGVSLDWEVLAQTAQALKDHQLLGLAADCHPETLRQMRWANAKIKETAPQVMVTR